MIYPTFYTLTDNNNKVLDTITDSRLYADIALKTNTSVELFSWLNVCGVIVYFHEFNTNLLNKRDNDGKLTIVKCKPKELRVDSVFRLWAPLETETIKSSRIVCRNEGYQRFFLLTVSDSSWKLWSLYTNSPAKLLYQKNTLLKESVTSSSFTFAQSDTGYKDFKLSEEFKTEINSLHYTTGNTILMNFINDSYYQYKIDDGKIMVVLPLGGKEIKTVSLSENLTALYAMNGKKIFILKK
jgi:hypothetical protein